MYVVTRRYSQTKPPLGCSIDWSNPLARGLVGVWLMNEGGGNTLHDIVNQNNSSLIKNSLLWKIGLKGQELSLTNGGTLSFGTSAILHPSKVTYRVIVKINNLADTTIGFATTTDSNGNAGFQLGYSRFSANKYFWYGWHGGNPDRLDSTNNATSGYHDVIGTFGYGGSFLNLYVDGVSQGSPIASTVSIGSNALVIGRNFSDYDGQYTNIEIILFQVYNRALSPSEIQSLYVAPFQFIQPIRRIFYSIPTTVVAGIKTGQFSRIQQISRVKQVIV